MRTPRGAAPLRSLYQIFIMHRLVNVVLVESTSWDQKWRRRKQKPTRVVIFRSLGHHDRTGAASDLIFRFNLFKYPSFVSFQTSNFTLTCRMTNMTSSFFGLNKIFVSRTFSPRSSDPQRLTVACSPLCVVSIPLHLRSVKMYTFYDENCGRTRIL